MTTNINMWPLTWICGYHYIFKHVYVVQIVHIVHVVGRKNCQKKCFFGTTCIEMSLTSSNLRSHLCVLPVVEGLTCGISRWVQHLSTCRIYYHQNVKADIVTVYIIDEMMWWRRTIEHVIQSYNAIYYTS